jgi:hypothetical protein
MTMSREFDKCIFYETPPRPFHPPGSFPGKEMFFLDGLVVPEIPLRLMTAYFTGPWTEEETYKPHAHPHDEMLMFLGTDYSRPNELGGEIEFWFKDDKYLLTRACAIFVPKMVQHAPMLPRRVDDPLKPICFVGFVPSRIEDDINYYSRNPKWEKWKNPPDAPGVMWME